MRSAALLPVLLLPPLLLHMSVLLLLLLLLLRLDLKNVPEAALAGVTGAVEPSPSSEPGGVLLLAFAASSCLILSSSTSICLMLNWRGVGSGHGDRGGGQTG